ncbi:MAG: hypothetical protein PHR00_00825 [Patescibacteria group bacterium]|nr:hypothetical protein [Patescibacteria group bacterium]
MLIIKIVICSFKIKGDDMKTIGFSSGSLTNIANPYSKDGLRLLERSSNQAIEIVCHDSAEASKLKYLASEIKHFYYKSLCLPLNHHYKNNKETRRLLDCLYDFCQYVDINLMIVEPNLVENWNIFSDYPAIWSIKNGHLPKNPFVDNNNDFINFFEKHSDWCFVLNLNNAYRLDNYLRLAERLIKINLGHLAEIQLSGSINYREPLFQTKQNQLIDCCRHSSAPIIIESIFNNVSEISEELEYVKNYL